MQGDKYPETICTIPQLSPFEQGERTMFIKTFQQQTT